MTGQTTDLVLADELSGIPAVIGAALASAEPAVLEEGKRYIVTTPSGSVVLIDNDLDAFRAGPRRHQGTTVVRDSTSLLTLIEDLGDVTRVYADPVARSIIAVLNDHTGNQAAFRDHRVNLALSPTPEWQRWAKHDGQLLAQAAFAEHLEDCAEDIASPDAATLLEIAQSLQATSSAEFKAGVRLTSGQRQFQYVETVNATAGQTGALEIPETFRLGLSPWTGGTTPYAVTARLRYRISAEGLKLGYRLVDPDRILAAAFEDVLTPIRVSNTVILGTP